MEDEPGMSVLVPTIGIGFAGLSGEDAKAHPQHKQEAQSREVGPERGDARIGWGLSWVVVRFAHASLSTRNARLRHARPARPWSSVVATLMRTSLVLINAM